ncbi:aminotransferase class V-fold PLP-dependent enzyme [Xylanibacillus composti]|uniref:Selenocysteine synthase n=1 Tax=Xylanibacillus composti TaxID=1572762 RepID=A0A8J4M3X8_9BACL|nr:aminotransferase class V-fold PLP-dependent enzyme [Xylanibacillus composti]MDT9726340.1 aminotransferase class V-fold PLP-dependent enzyme [Xylanibacillus composti]GIQ70552.1 selenocysteine synthase [Xylanibacillus composti]
MPSYKNLGVRTLINAVDTYTIIGGSLMPEEVIHAMVEAGKSFVNIEELQDKAGQRLAQLTRNESALITNGAAAGMAIVTAACVAGDDLAKAERLPDTLGMKNEVIMHRSQRNGYDHAIRQVGVKLVEIGNVDVTYPWQLESAINDRTACIFYFDAATLKKGVLPLETVIEIGQKHGIPVIVDAAAQLPPVENLWRFTEMGATAAIFSGGKTLRGPQCTGLVVGKRDLIHACRIHMSPRHSIGRSMKVGKEEMMGLLAAVERYIRLDHAKVTHELEQRVQLIQKSLNNPGLTVQRVFPGPVGQHYPRAAVILDSSMPLSALELKNQLEWGEPGIMVGLTPDEQGIIINPLNLQDHEIPLIIDRMKALLSME